MRVLVPLLSVPSVRAVRLAFKATSCLIRARIRQGARRLARLLGLRVRVGQAGGGGPAASIEAAAYSLRWLLILLVVASAGPMALLVGLNVLQAARSDVAAANESVVRLANVTAADTEQALVVYRQLLTVATQSPGLRSQDPARCDSGFDAILKQYPSISNVATVDMEGRVICSALNLSDSDTRSISTDSWLRQIKSGEQFVIGAPQRGALFPDRWVVVLAKPLLNEERQITGAVRITLNLAAIHPIVSGYLPDGAVAGLIDSEGTVLARSFNPQEIVGRNVRGIGINNDILQRQEGTAVAVGADGNERFYAFKPVAGTRWYATVGMPTDRVYMAARKNAIQNGAWGIIVVVVAACLVLLVSRRVVLPLAAMREAALQFSEGKKSARALVAGPSEVAEVALTLNRLFERVPEIEARLQTSEEQYRKLFDASPDAIRVACDGKVTLANPAALRLFGYSTLESIVGRDVYGMIEPDLRERVRDRLARVVAEGVNVGPMEMVVVRPDGSETPVEVISMPFEFNGRTAVLSILHDLTERRAAEAALRRMNADLEKQVARRTNALHEANRELESFSYTVAHDLRAPLRRIAGFASLLLDDNAASLDHNGRDAIDRIVGGVRAMDDLIDGLLKVSQYGRGELQLSEVDLSGLAREVVTALVARDQERRVSVKIAPGVSVVGDERLLRSVLENLIGNAFKFTARKAEATIEFGTRFDEGECAFFVRDNGVGFDPNHSGQLFKTFHRLHSKGDFEGTGIGLASVRRIIHHHGGRVWAEAVPNEGAVFYFTLKRGLGGDIP